MENSERQKKYDAFSRGPFFVYFKISTVDESRKKFPCFRVPVAKKLNSINIKFNEIVRYSYNVWRVIFPSKLSADSVLTNPMLEKVGISAFIPRFKLSRKGVIKGIPEDINRRNKRSHRNRKFESVNH